MIQKTINSMSALETIKHINSGELTVTKVVRACLKQIERLEPTIHAWAHLDGELALRQAADVDRKIAEGEAVGALSGVPVGVKDIFNTVDIPTEMGSPIWAGFTPGNDARVVHYIRMADAVILGKTVTAEFAVHTPGPTANPHNPDHMPGTSSSGSAAAVACGMVPLALGTQTAGSTIRPASYCGVYGFKPSFGLIPRTGMLKTTDSLDTIGLFSRTVNDLTLFFDVIRVHGQDYPITHSALNDPGRQEKGDRPWRVALVRGTKWEDAEAYAQQALFGFAEDLSKVHDITLDEVILPDSFKLAHDIHLTIYNCTLAYYFKEEFKQHRLVSEVMYEIITCGNQVPLDQYKDALDKQHRLAQKLDEFFVSGYDILLSLSTGGEAKKGLDSADRPDDCLIWTLCGVPAMNLPVFKGPLDLPFGAQVVARRYNDILLLNFVKALAKNGQVGSAPYPLPAIIANSDATPKLVH